jgi:hypothetical protein
MGEGNGATQIYPHIYRHVLFAVDTYNFNKNTHYFNISTSLESFDSKKYIKYNTKTMAVKAIIQPNYL